MGTQRLRSHRDTVRCGDASAEHSKDAQFLARLQAEFFQSVFNNFGKRNYDQLRFGAYPRRSIGTRVQNHFRKRAIPIGELRELQQAYDYYASTYADDLTEIYQHIDEPSRHLLIKLIAFRALGFRRVMLPANNAKYWEALRIAEGLKDPHDTIDPKFMHFLLAKFNLREIGYHISMYHTDLGVAVDFLLEQYAYKADGETIVEAVEGDTVIDCGGCWGDTALYFAEKTGAAGRVYSFEFIPGNIRIFKTNLELNPKLEQRISLVEHPVWETSGRDVFFRDHGPGSAVSLTPLENQTGSATTLSIDDLVEREKIAKVDYIKMDIEGAEPHALRGASKTIEKFRPKLAIAIYHSMEDFINIPKRLIGLDLGYKFYLGHYSIHAEETVIFASPE